MKRIDIETICITLPMGRTGATGTMNCYLLKGRTRSLLIDPGYPSEESYKVLKSALDSLGVSFEQLDIFITHGHTDHFGLLERVIQKDSSVYIHLKDWKMMLASQQKSYWHVIEERFFYNGWPKVHELCYQSRNYVPLNRSLDLKINLVADGSIINLDGRRLVCLALPGHTIGQIGLFDEGRNYLFTGDLVLDKSFPNLFMREPVEGILTFARQSLSDKRILGARFLLTGHGEPINRPEIRCHETWEHYVEIVESVYELARSQPDTAYGLSQRYFAKRWDRYNFSVKNFLMGDILVCAEYLVSMGRLAITEENNVRIFIA